MWGMVWESSNDRGGILRGDMMAKAIDLTGQVFGRWTVLERDYSSPG